VYTADMRPCNAAVLIAVLTTTQGKTAEGQRAESASTICAVDTGACLGCIRKRHGGLSIGFAIVIAQKWSLSNLRDAG
jgi:hypothetical protein